MGEVTPGTYRMLGSDRTGDAARWLEGHGQRAVPVGLPGAEPLGVMWTRRDDPNGVPRFARMWEFMVHDPATGEVRVDPDAPGYDVRRAG